MIYFGAIKFIVIYGFIFSMITLIMIFASHQVLSQLATEYANLQLDWMTAFSKGVNIVVLCLSASLLLLCWLNAAVVICLLLMVAVIAFLSSQILIAAVLIAVLLRVAGFVSDFVSALFQWRSTKGRVSDKNEELGMTVNEVLDLMGKSGLLSGPRETPKESWTHKQFSHGKGYARKLFVGRSRKGSKGAARR